MGKKKIKKGSIAAVDPKKSGKDTQGYYLMVTIGIHILYYRSLPLVAVALAKLAL